MEIEYKKVEDNNINRNILDHLFSLNSIKPIYQHSKYIENNSENSFLFVLKINQSIKSYCFVNEYSLTKLKFIKYCKIRFGSIGDIEYASILDHEIVKYYASKKTTSIFYIPFENDIIETINKTKFPIILAKRETGSLIINLQQDIENVEKNYSTNLKRNLKKSKKLDLVIKELNTGDEFIKLNEIYNKLFEHRKIKISNSNFTLDTIKLVIQQNLGFVLGCFENNELIGGSVLLENNNRIEYFIGASNPDFRHLPILHAVFHHAIKHSKKLNYKYFDLGGIVFTKENEQLSNITNFKFQFSKDVIIYKKDFELILSKKRKWIYNLYLKLSKKKNE